VAGLISDGKGAAAAAECERKRFHVHRALIRCLDALLVHDASRGSSEVPNPTLPRAVHIIREREGVAGACHPIELLRVVHALLGAEWRRDLLEQAFPLCFLAALNHFTANKEVDHISPFRMLHPFLEWQCEDTRMVSQPPIVHLGACESCAVDP
jgi:hypothetical protein